MTGTSPNSKVAAGPGPSGERDVNASDRAAERAARLRGMASDTRQVRDDPSGNSDLQQHAGMAEIGLPRNLSDAFSQALDEEPDRVQGAAFADRHEFVPSRLDFESGALDGAPSDESVSSGVTGIHRYTGGDEPLR
jgi:hypothetical protein